MTKDAALYQFFSSIGLTAYQATAVPDDVVYPYLTYTNQTDSWGGSVSLTVNIWSYTASEAVANANARLLSDAVPRGGVMVDCDDGTLWLKRGTPWCTSLSDASDSNVKQRYFNLTVEFETTD